MSKLRAGACDKEKREEQRCNAGPEQHIVQPGLLEFHEVFVLRFQQEGHSEHRIDMRAEILRCKELEEGSRSKRAGGELFSL